VHAPEGPLIRGSERFCRAQRLTTAAAFARVFAEAQRSSDSYFVVLGRVNLVGTPRLGLAISRRAARRATERNRLKRITRETFRQLQGLPDWDFVVMAKPLACQTSSSVLRLSLQRHFERLSARTGAST
jgi:ribonuclease P protein component